MGSSGPAEVKELVALVTGGASGIGRAVANKLASRGVSIVIGDLNEEQGTKAAAEIAKEFNVRSHFHQVNVTQEAQVKALVEAATALTGRLDYAANCAGICEAIWEEEESITTELFDR
jgi:3-hydroxyacyl-CoA dehydrogenase / 3-hydroxy-2-methylbutyryl-CoA dehydrogenase